MSRSLLMMLCVVIGVLVLACGAPPTNKSGPVNSAATTTAASPAPSAAATVAAAGDQIGVPECDSFLKSYEDCVGTKVPEAARAQFRTTMTTWRTEWKKLAQDPQTRAGLVQACKSQIETQRTAMKAYNCTF